MIFFQIKRLFNANTPARNRDDIINFLGRCHKACHFRSDLNAVYLHGRSNFIYVPSPRDLLIPKSLQVIFRRFWHKFTLVKHVLKVKKTNLMARG